MNDAFDTAKTLVDDLPSLTASAAKPGSKAILPVLAERGVYVWLITCILNDAICQWYYDIYYLFAV